MITSKKPVVTRREYEDMPAGPPYYQVIQGGLFMSPSPTPHHREAAGILFRKIGNFLEENPIGKVYISPVDVFLDDLNVYQPDVLFIRADRLSIILEKGIEGAPDLVAEVLSPSTAKYDLGAKRAVYARSGVKEFWVADPAEKALRVFRFAESAEEPAAVLAGASPLESPLLPGFAVSVEKVFEPLTGRSLPTAK